MRNKLKKEFQLDQKLSIEELKNNIIGDLNEINKFIKNSKEKFDVNSTIANYYSTINERAKQFANMLSTPPSTPMLTPKKKGKDFEPMPLPLDPEDKKEIEKMIENPEMKAQIIDKIMKAFPSFKKEQLDSLSVKDLLEISITLGFDFSEEAITAKEKKEKILSDAAEILKEKFRNKKSAKKSSQTSVKTPKPKINQIEEKYIESIKKSKPKGKIQLNEQQVLGLGFLLEQNLDLIKNSDIGVTEMQTKPTKKSTPVSAKKENPSSKRKNPFLEFMKEFRKENAGKFDAKMMMKEGAKAYNEQKNG
eukprot:gene12914-7425_t